MSSLCWNITVTALANIASKRKIIQGDVEVGVKVRKGHQNTHIEREAMSHEMLAKTQTGWHTETERDKSL